MGASKAGQVTLSALYKRKEPLARESVRSQEITKVIAEMIVADMHALSLVEAKGFKNYMSVMEPRYCTPSTKHMLEKHIRPMYHSTVQDVENDIAKADCHAVTTDAWQSAGTQFCDIHMPFC